ncbi:unnamed protein product [Psylliodes chrysocephalus]|uniref:Uncharacterized protein n=1 Tax=Psylliodes chrysocephalus TaxID=3402493 RepID=A0A9P0D5N8_9CUCU|nr:unnamed protein product [Psylliodes chrysocephala]
MTLKFFYFSKKVISSEISGDLFKILKIIVFDKDHFDKKSYKKKLENGRSFVGLLLDVKQENDVFHVLGTFPKYVFHVVGTFPKNDVHLRFHGSFWSSIQNGA